MFNRNKRSWHLLWGLLKIYYALNHISITVQGLHERGYQKASVPNTG